MKGGAFWAAVPVVLLGSLTTGLGIAAWIASDDPSFAVERNYYDKAVHFDQAREQAQKNASLGWRVELDTKAVGSNIQLLVLVKDKDGLPIRDAAITVEAFANARAKDVVIARFVPEPGAPQSARLPLIFAGLWELRFTVEARGERFTETLRRDIVAGGS
jgi:hypothetical protein